MVARSEEFVSPEAFAAVTEAEAWAREYRERKWGYYPRTRVVRRTDGLYVVHIVQWSSCD
jgi:hypothetical protein